jgi:hypothetical protein
VAPISVIGISEDAHGRSGSPSTNYGNSPALDVRTANNDNRWAYLSVDTSARSGTITSAILRLFVRNAGGGTNNVAVRSVATTTWAQASLNWNNRPATGSTLANFTVNSTTGSWVSVNVTAYVAAERLAGRTRVCFALVEPSRGSLVQVDSREASANRPEIVLS